MKHFFLSLVVVSAFFLTSCNDDNSVNQQPLGKTKISGTAFAQFDFSNEKNETVPNKKVLVSIYDNFNGSVRFAETTTDANGNYTFEFEMGNRPLEVHLNLIDFKANVDYGDITEEKIFYGTNFSANADVVKGGEYILDMYYNN